MHGTLLPYTSSVQLLVIHPLSGIRIMNVVVICYDLTSSLKSRKTTSLLIKINEMHIIFALIPYQNYFFEDIYYAVIITLTHIDSIWFLDTPCSNCASTVYYNVLVVTALENERLYSSSQYIIL